MKYLVRRRWCRAAFVVLCLLPTLAVSGWANLASRARETARLHAAWEARLRELTGLRAHAGAVIEGHRGNVVFQNLVLSDPETGAEVVRAREIEIAPAGPRGATVIVAYPEVSPGQLGRLWEPLYDRLRAARGGGEWTGIVMARSATLHLDAERAGTASHTFSSFECRFSTREAGGLAEIEFTLDGYGMEKPARVLVARNRDLLPPETEVVVHTGAEPLPCSLISEVIPAMRHLGPQATFAGSTKWRLGIDGWRGEQLEGTLHNVAFDQLLGENFPHHYVQATGTVEIRRGEFQQGRLVAAEGTRRCGAGRIGRALLLAATDALGCRLLQPLEADRIAFHELATQFRIDSSGLALRGAALPAGTLIRTTEGPLLVENPAPVPVVALLRLLVPDSMHQVPATQQTGWLTDVLPVPDLAPNPRAARRPLDSPTLRLSESVNGEG